MSRISSLASRVWYYILCLVSCVSCLASPVSCPVSPFSCVPCRASRVLYLVCLVELGHVTSRNVRSTAQCRVVSSCVVLRRGASCRVVSCHVMSCHVTSCYVMSRHATSCHPWTRGDSNLQTVENRQGRGKTVAVRVRFPPTSVFRPFPKFPKIPKFPEILGQNPERALHDRPAPKIFRKFWAVGSKASKSCREEPPCSHGSLFRKPFPGSKISRFFF